MLIDTHAHLYWDSYKDDLDQVVQRALDAGVSTIINVGVDVEKSQVAAVLESDKIKFYSTIGIHPHEALKYDSDVSIHRDIERLEQIYQNGAGKVVAVGECGFDYFFDPEFTPSTLSPAQIKNFQRKLFQAQIDLAKKLNLPLIVHCRDDRSQNSTNSEAWDEVLKMVGYYYPTILHCYSGLSHTTNHILQTTNILVSFAATITYPKNEYLRKAAKSLPLEKMVLETDCPFLPPQSKRGQRNEPANIKEIAQLVANLKGLSLEEVAYQTTANLTKIFAF